MNGPRHRPYDWAKEPRVEDRRRHCPEVDSHPVWPVADIVIGLFVVALAAFSIVQYVTQ